MNKQRKDRKEFVLEEAAHIDYDSCINVKAGFYYVLHYLNQID